MSRDMSLPIAVGPAAVAEDACSVRVGLNGMSQRRSLLQSAASGMIT
jgi:hypothetical protein